MEPSGISKILAVLESVPYGMRSSTEGLFFSGSDCVITAKNVLFSYDILSTSADVGRLALIGSTLLGSSALFFSGNTGISLPTAFQSIFSLSSVSGICITCDIVLTPSVSIPVSPILSPSGFIDAV